jgi:hypothetical protein
MKVFCFPSLHTHSAVCVQRAALPAMEHPGIILILEEMGNIWLRGRSKWTEWRNGRRKAAATTNAPVRQSDSKPVELRTLLSSTTASPNAAEGMLSLASEVDVAQLRAPAEKWNVAIAFSSVNNTTESYGMCIRCMARCDGGTTGIFHTELVLRAPCEGGPTKCPWARYGTAQRPHQDLTTRTDGYTYHLLNFTALIGGASSSGFVIKLDVPLDKEGQARYHWIGLEVPVVSEGTTGEDATVSRWEALVDFLEAQLEIGAHMRTYDQCACLDVCCSQWYCPCNQCLCADAWSTMDLWRLLPQEVTRTVYVQKKPPPTKRAWMCSEVVVSALVYAGIVNGRDLPPAWTTPYGLYRGVELGAARVYVKTVKLGRGDMRLPAAQTAGCHVRYGPVRQHMPKGPDELFIRPGLSPLPSRNRHDD